MVYSLSFFKNYRSNNHYTINCDIINKLVDISKNLNKGVILKIAQDTPYEYVFQKLKPVKVIQKTISDHDQKLIDIKSLLNKLSAENIPVISSKISELIKLSTDESIFQQIFEISYKNKFFSKNYSLLVISLCETNDSFNDFVNKNTCKLYTLYDDMNYISPNANYNEYCENVKKTDERSSYGCFYANLCASGFIEISEIKKFTDYLTGKISLLMNEEDKTHEIEEIADVIFLIINIVNVELDYDLLETISKTKNKTFKGITNKTIFKCMDIMDIKKSMPLS